MWDWGIFGSTFSTLCFPSTFAFIRHCLYKKKLFRQSKGIPIWVWVMILAVNKLECRYHAFVVRGTYYVGNSKNPIYFLRSSNFSKDISICSNIVVGKKRAIRVLSRFKLRVKIFKLSLWSQLKLIPLFPSQTINLLTKI